jgi:hypothetical protein
MTVCWNPLGNQIAVGYSDGRTILKKIKDTVTEESTVIDKQSEEGFDKGNQFKAPFTNNQNSELSLLDYR